MISGEAVNREKELTILVDTVTGVRGDVRNTFNEKHDGTLLSMWNVCDEMFGNDPISGICANLLYATYPKQMAVTDRVLKDLVRFMLDNIRRIDRVDTSVKVVGGRVVSSSRTSFTKETVEKNFAIKKDHPGALLKVNLFLSDVVSSYKMCDMEYVEAMDSVTDLFVSEGYANDTMAAIYIHNHELFRRGVCHVHEIIYLLRYHKQVTSIIKALGMNSILEGSLLCELGCLLGRGIKPVVWEDDMLYRVDTKGIKEKVYDVDQTLLRDSIIKILEQELPRKVEFENLGDYWSKRWLWCVNGAHSRLVERENGVDTTSYLEGRVHRRVHAENLKSEPVSKWNGQTYTSTAEKLEHGKSRALYSCDTITYYAFNHFLSPIEKMWANRWCLLNPSSQGMTPLVDRIRMMRHRYNYSIMLDYEDFNSQHSLESMKTLYKTVGEHVGYDGSLLDKLLHSIDNNMLYHNNKFVGKMVGTLCSGHRGTSFVNTLLNKAYLLCVLPKDLVWESLHVGDDVVLFVSEIGDCAKVLSSFGESGLRAQSIKQSCGTNCSEFLRCCISSYKCNGYLARSVASLVSGNWENERKLKPSETLSSMYSTIWSMINRSGNGNIGLCCYSTVNRLGLGIGKRGIKSILTCHSSVNCGPVMGRRGVYTSYVVKERSEDRIERGVSYLNNCNAKHYATSSYLTEHTSKMERSVLLELGVSPLDEMRVSSYSKNIDRSLLAQNYVTQTTVQEKVCKVEHRKYDKNTECGVLLKYPLIVFYKSQLNAVQLQKILYQEVGEFYDLRDCHYIAFGEYEAAYVVVTPCIFADIGRIASYRGNNIVMNNYYYCM
uniref:RNA-directed RNA polymerase n=1 Tax=Riboviria sp. TaxID=2585031 RepID=A0A8B0RKR1_9VIRU|nr:RNA-dependent RNA polymerase [Riboviria sp.]